MKDDSIEIVDLALDAEKPLGLASDGGGEAITTSRNNVPPQHFNRSIESSQDPKKSHRFNRNDFSMMTDPQNQSVIIEKDKLLAPS